MIGVMVICDLFLCFSQILICTDVRMAADSLGSIVIVGGGIIGCSIAYHITELGVPCTLVERCSIACGASGKAGGFLAR